MDVLGAEATLVPVCPEMELGLGTPRKTLALIRRRAGTRLIMAGGRDYTEEMTKYARDRIASASMESLDGYVLKSRSPSCGVADVPVFDARGVAVGTESGLFAAALLARWPGLPVVTESLLVDEASCRAFLSRATAYHSHRIG
jgi:uncharacterized protein YbbK (DUF523 family)